MNQNEILEKIENMPAAELSKLFCEALDEAGIEYEVGKSDIKFSGLSIDDHLHTLHKKENKYV